MMIKIESYMCCLFIEYCVPPQVIFLSSRDDTTIHIPQIKKLELDI